MRTAAELFADLEPGAEAHLDGETIIGSKVTDVPSDVTIEGGIFTGELELHDANGLELVNLAFEGDDSTQGLHGLCRLLGGHGWKITDCIFSSGVVASQLGVGLSSSRDNVPTDWLVEGCAFGPLGGQWGTYPQGHNLYVLTSPRVDMNGRVERCSFSGSVYGAAVKLGGTGNFWRSEGVRGIDVVDCEVGGVLDGAGRCLAVLTQGARTRDVVLHGCTLRGEGAAPWVQATDGAEVRLEGCRFPDGVVHHATWYVGPFGLVQRDTKEARAGRALGGGIIYA